MNNLRTTITTLDVAEMMELEHWKLLRKLEGRTDKEGNHTKGYIDILGDNHLVVTDFFIKSTYRTEQNKELPCYNVTKMGCDFLANKFTGEKGVVFTARYVKRFNELEGRETEKIYETKATSLGEVASFNKEMDRRMEKQGSAPWKICEAFKMVSEQFGIRLPEDFVEVPKYEQMQLTEFKIRGKNYE